MGIVRSEPDTNISVDSVQKDKFNYISASTCGWQYFMEDYIFSFNFSDEIFVMGIVDGQCGPQVAQFCHNQIPQIIKNCQLMQLEQYQGAIQNLCYTLDERILNSHAQINQIRKKYNLTQLPINQQTPSFASLVVCIIDNQSVTIGNIGQCKAYVSYKYSSEKAVLISGNHTIQKQEDQQKIIQKGGFVVNNMVNGKFIHTRAIGNLKYKNFDNQARSVISSEPSVFSLRLQDLHAIVMGSSGLWQRPQWVLKHILGKEHQNDQLQQISKQLLNILVAQDVSQQCGKQNISISTIIIK